MPITQSAKKALRQSSRRRSQNLKRKRAEKDAVKELRRLVVQKKMEEAKALLPKAFQALDKAAKSGALKRNTASRLKSRLSRLFNKKSA